MQRPDFRNEAMRLANGFGVELTHDRLEALWGRFGSLHRDVWAAAVTECLCEPRYPTLARLDTAVASHKPDIAPRRLEPLDEPRHDYDLEAERRFRAELRQMAAEGNYFAKAFLDASPSGPNERDAAQQR